MNARSKVLFLLHIPPPIHGSSIVGMNIMESDIINEQFDCEFVNLLASKSTAESGNISLGKIWGYIWTIKSVVSKIIKARPKLCYFALSTTGAAFYKDMILVAILKLFGIRIVYHLHNKGIANEQDRYLQRSCYHYVFKGQKAIVLSKYLYSDIEKFIPETDLFICPNGVVDNVGLVRTRTVNKRNLNEVNILFLSNLIESKGVVILMKALKVIKNRGVEFKCNLVGGEADLNALQLQTLIVQLDLADVVFYEGKKYGEEKHLAFTNADIFVLPTFYSNECFPLVLLEAMSFSLPIVSTYEGGIPDIIDNGITGFLVPQQDVESLASKLEILIKDDQIRMDMGVKGRVKFEKLFTLNKFENAMEGILSELVDTNKNLIMQLHE